MAVVAVIAGVVAGASQSSAARKGRMASESRTRGAQAYQKEIYGGAKDRFAPYIKAGKYGIEGARDLLKDPSSITKTPGYQFRLGEGRRTREQSAAARGSLFSGSTMEELIRYGQNFASEEYQNEFSRRMQLAGTGIQANTVVSNVGMKAASNIAGLSTAQNETGLEYRAQQEEGRQQIISSIGNYASGAGGSSSIPDFSGG